MDAQIEKVIAEVAEMTRCYPQALRELAQRVPEIAAETKTDASNPPVLYGGPLSDYGYQRGFQDGVDAHKRAVRSLADGAQKRGER